MSYARLETNYYTTSSIWDLDFDLRKVRAWYVRWDSLFVQHNIGDKWVEYPPCYSAEDDIYYIKHPKEYYVDEVLVEFKKDEYHNPLRGMNPKNPGKRLIFPS